MLSDIRNLASPLLTVATLIKYNNPEKDPKEIIFAEETINGKKFSVTLFQIFQLCEAMREENYKHYKYGNEDVGNNQ